MQHQPLLMAIARSSLAKPASRYMPRLILLGTAGGPILSSHDRFGTSTAVAFGSRVYVIDLGLGALQRLGRAGLGPAGVPNGALSRT